MAITQLNVFKEMPYLVSNTMALFTCFPMTIAIIILGKFFIGFLENQLLMIAGSISYEIYLVHAFTLKLVQQDLVSGFIFLIVCFSTASILNLIMREIKNDRFNCNNINKK